MIEQDYIKKFTDVVEHHQLDKAKVFDVATAICIADNKWGTDTQKLSVKRLENSGVDYFRGISKVSEPAKPLPDVQIMRILCDTLYICLYTKLDSIKDKVHLTCPSSVEVSIGYHLKGRETTYCDIEECKRILDLFNSLRSNNVSDKVCISKFIDYVEHGCSCGYILSGLVLNSAYEDSFSQASFLDRINFNNSVKSNIYDSLTDKIIDTYLRDTNRLKTSLLIASKARILGTKKYVLKLSPDKYKSIRADSFVYNALSPLFTFTHADSLQNMDSIIVLYGLLFAGVEEIKNVNSYIGG